MREIVKELVRSIDNLPAHYKFTILISLINSLTILIIIYLFTR